MFGKALSSKIVTLISKRNNYGKSVSFESSELAIIQLDVMKGKGSKNDLQMSKRDNKAREESLSKYSDPYVICNV